MAGMQREPRAGGIAGASADSAARVLPRRHAGSALRHCRRDALR